MVLEFVIEIFRVDGWTDGSIGRKDWGKKTWMGDG